MREDKIFLDTNVLVYAHDISAVAKHKSEPRLSNRLNKINLPIYYRL